MTLSPAPLPTAAPTDIITGNTDVRAQLLGRAGFVAPTRYAAPAHNPGARVVATGGGR